MGTFDQKCVLSGLSIAEGDKVFSLPMAFSSKSFYHSFRLVDDNKVMLSTPIIANYDGYGGFENIENINILKHLIRKIKECFLLERPSFYNKYFFIKKEEEEIKNSNFVYFDDLASIYSNKDYSKFYNGDFPSEESEFISEFKNLFSFSGDLYFHSFLFVNFNFFNKLKEAHYVDFVEKVKKGLNDKLSENYFKEAGFYPNIPVVDYADKLLEFSMVYGIEDFVETIGLDGNSKTIREYYKIFRSFQDVKLKQFCQVDKENGFYQVAFDSFVENIVNLSLVLNMVADLGVSLLPPPKLKNCSRVVEGANDIVKDLLKEKNSGY